MIQIAECLVGLACGRYHKSKPVHPRRCILQITRPGMMLSKFLLRETVQTGRIFMLFRSVSLRWYICKIQGPTEISSVDDGKVVRLRYHSSGWWRHEIVSSSAPWYMHRNRFRIWSKLEHCKLIVPFARSIEDLRIGYDIHWLSWQLSFASPEKKPMSMMDHA
jgi:hypothetical protein